MRLALSINGVSRLVASVESPGYLSAHLNLHECPKEQDNSKSIRLKGIQTLDSETIFFDWPSFDLQTGDSVELRVLDEGEGEKPSSVRRSSESPQNLFSDPKLAKELLTLISGFESNLMKLVDASDKNESEEEHRKFKNAVGHVLVELGDRFLYPIYRRHKELIPEEVKGELL